MSKGSVAHVGIDELIRLRLNARGLELGARRRALSAQAGGYVSIYRGRGLEFDEVRTYQAGDDARTIDWRVTARRGRPHTKLFREERERPVFLLVDFHPGMYFGTRRQLKSALVARTAALLAWAAQQAGDRVGGIVSSTGERRILHPRARRAGTLSLLQAVAQGQPRAPGEISQGRMDTTLAAAVHLVHPGSRVFILSDFRELGTDAETYLASLAKHNDVMLGIAQDPLEAAPPPSGRYQMGTPQQSFVLDTGSAALAAAWRASFNELQERLRGISRRYRLHPIALSTADDPLQSLRYGLARHGKAA